MIFFTKILHFIPLTALLLIICMPADGAPVSNPSAMPNFKHSLTHEERLQQIFRNAERGIPQFASLLGDMYLNGMNVEKNAYKAAEWFSKAAQLNEPLGLFNMGYLHAEGKGGVPHDDAKAFKYFMQAFERGFPPASMWIGEFYRDGRGVKQDREQALRWFAAACSGGSDERANALAGRPTEEQRQKAAKLMQRTAMPDGRRITCHEL
jgi:TPR repeat protein